MPAQEQQDLEADAEMSNVTTTTTTILNVLKLNQTCKKDKTVEAQQKSKKC
jgi:hypothetical protein